MHSLRADIDYGVSTSHTAYGTIGIKVWVYKGEKSTDEKKESENNIAVNKVKDK